MLLGASKDHRRSCPRETGAAYTAAIPRVGLLDHQGLLCLGVDRTLQTQPLLPHHESPWITPIEADGAEVVFHGKAPELVDRRLLTLCPGEAINVPEAENRLANLDVLEHELRHERHGLTMEGTPTA